MIEPKGFVELHSGALTILVLAALLLGTLLVLVPQLLKSHSRALEFKHEEVMRSLESGLPSTPTDERSLATGRMVVLVPIFSVCAAATVTCFLVAYGAESVFSVGLTVWSVAGVVALAAVTGGVALMGRLAQLSAGEDDQEEQPEALRRNFMEK